MLVFKIGGVGKFKKQQCYNLEGLTIFNSIILSFLPKSGTLDL